MKNTALLLAAACSALLAATAATGAGTNSCGTFDTERLRGDLESNYFERGGIQLAKATLAIMAEQLECERKGR